MNFFGGIKEFGKIAKKAYVPSREDRLEKFASKEAKKENEIKKATEIYSEKTSIPLTDPRIKEFEIKARLKADEPRKPIFENLDKGMQTLDNAFGSPKKNSLPEINDSISKPISSQKRPRVLDDPWGKSF